MAGLDLSGVQEWLEAEILVDTLEFTRDNGAADATLNEDGDLVEPAPALLYSGPGAIQSIDGYSAVPDPDVQRILKTTDAKYRAFVPLGAEVDLIPGDQGRITAQGGNNPNNQILRREFEVVELGDVGTHAVVQFVYLKQTGATPA